MKKEIKGQGAVQNIHNRFIQHRYEKSIYDDDFEETVAKTELLEVFPKTIVNTVKSPDLHMMYSMNPYQGCEHGCAYCFARPTHEYWGTAPG
jgi:tRNA A37 methylthiotransferase MiaB